MRRAIKLILAFAIIAAPAYGTEFRRAETFEDCHAASCRVNVADARGTGTFFKEMDGWCYVLTNCHVVGKHNTARLDFWTNGEVESVDGAVIWRASDATEPWDFALIKVKAQELETINPPYIPLMGKDGRPTVESYIISAGAPKGRHIQAWKGKILEYYQERTAIFQPAPVPGQSGSSIVSIIDGQPWISAILTWLIGTEGSDEAKGGAIPIANLYKATKNKRMQETGIYNESDPIPPNASECSEPLNLELPSSDRASQTNEEDKNDFRQRTPIRQAYTDASLFDDADNEWETRSKRGGIVDRIEDKIEDRADEYIEKKTPEIKKEVNKLSSALFWLVVFAAIVGNIIAVFIRSVMEWSFSICKGGASMLIKRAAQHIETNEGKKE